MKLIAGMRSAWQYFAPATKQDVERILMKVSQLAGVLTALTTEVDKIKTEVEALKSSLSDVELPAEAQTALDNLTTHVQAVDDLNPDAPPAANG